MNDFVKKVGLTLILVFVPLMLVQAQDNVVIGNGVIKDTYFCDIQK